VLGSALVFFWVGEGERRGVAKGTYEYMSGSRYSDLNFKNGSFITEGNCRYPCRVNLLNNANLLESSDLN
jgi:hypothetical protein